MHLAAPPKQVPSKRDTLRLAIPSKGRMAEDTQQLLKVHMQSAASSTYFV